MTIVPTAETMNRTAKLFMDRGEVASYAEALTKLEGFALGIDAGPEVITSASHQFAVLTAVNAGRRTFLGGVSVSLSGDALLLLSIAGASTLHEAIVMLGGKIGVAAHGVPRLRIGSVHTSFDFPAWQVTWDGWRGGVIPSRDSRRLAEPSDFSLCAGLASVIGLSEVFQFFDGSAWAGRRSAGASLWHPGADWLVPDPNEPHLSLLPTQLWLLGLGNLGQAYLWMLRSLPFPDGHTLDLILQDFDVVSAANETTSVLTEPGMVGERKTREMAKWAKAVGFTTTIVERRFGPLTRRDDDEPSIALCGFDNALARSALEETGFDLVIEAGLGAGPGSFVNFSLHTFPGSRRASEIWKQDGGSLAPSPMTNEAYANLLEAKVIDECGLTLLASRSVGVPFVSLTAAAFVVAELLRRLHEGPALEILAGSVFDLESVESVEGVAAPFPGTFTTLQG